MDQAQIEHALGLLQQENRQLAERLNQLQTAQSSSQSAVAIPKNPKITMPDKFDGNPQNLRGFVNQIKLIIEQQPVVYQTNRSRVLLVGSLLTATALQWFNPLFEKDDATLLDFASFLKKLEARFSDPNRSAKARAALSIPQGKTVSVAQHASSFQLHLVDSGYDTIAAVDLFRKSLHEDVKDLLLTFKDPENLEELITNANVCYMRLEQRRNDRSNRPSTSFSASLPVMKSNDPVPMELDALVQQAVTKALTAKPPAGARGPLTATIRKYRMDNGLCLYAGCAGHVAADCPLLAKRNADPENANRRR
jgi:hypothetical protein